MGVEPRKTPSPALMGRGAAAELYPNVPRYGTSCWPVIERGDASAGERVHPDCIDEVRRDLARAEEIARQDLLVRGDVRCNANDREFIQSALHPGDRLVPVAAPGDH